jgi:hypothetical protein
MGRENTFDDVDYCSRVLPDVIGRIRDMSKRIRKEAVMEKVNWIYTDKVLETLHASQEHLVDEEAFQAGRPAA